jgi:hypothetical protein
MMTGLLPAPEDGRIEKSYSSQAAGVITVTPRLTGLKITPKFSEA